MARQWAACLLAQRQSCTFALTSSTAIADNVQRNEERTMRSSTHLVSAATGFGVIAIAVAVWTGSPASANGSEKAPATRTGRVADAYAKLPLAFVENRGQTDARVRYYAQANRRAFYLTRDEIVLSLEKEKTRGLALALRLVGSNPHVVLDADERVAGEVNYIRGNDPAGWQTQLPRYGQIVYRELWNGIDLRLREQAGALKYEFRVRPGARPVDIRLAYAGASRLTLDDSGALLIKTGMGVLRDAPPVSYQMINGARVPVQSRYVLHEKRDDEVRYGFAVGAGYRPDHELIIDPGLEYSTFLGGSSDDIGAGIQVDANGNAYVVGTTQSPDFPTTVGAFRRTGAASNFGDVFVTKLNPSGTALVYSTFVGGGNFDWGRAIAIDAAGNAYVTGQTKSSNFPTTGGAFDRTFNVDTCPRCGIDQYDAFVFKLNAAGSGLVYSTFLGGFDLDDGLAIAVDGSGNAYVAGETGSLNFPTTAGAFDTTRNANFDTFVTKLNATGSALVYSTYLGGSGVEFPSHVAVDAARNIYITGSTSSADFPTTPGAFDTTANGGFDVFVTKLNSTGSALIFSTYLGGSGFDSGGGLAIDSAGNIYVSGGAGSVDFPTTPGAFDTLPDGSDAFITKLNPSGSALIYSTVLGGAASDGANAVAVDASGNAWVTGVTGSADFPVIVGAFDSSFNGTSDVFISELSADGSTLLYSTYLGGSNTDVGTDLALDSNSNVYVTGHTLSIDFPVTVGAFDTLFNGDTSIFWGDAFVAKLGAVSTPVAPPAVPSAPAPVAPANGSAPSQPITFQWSSASSAVSYTIQIDDSSAFSAPLVRDQNVTDLMYATSGLAASPHFWRVRGVNTAGVAGPWSAVWTFTPQPAPPPATLSTFSTNPSTVVGGDPSSGTVVLSSGAPFGGALISLSSSNPAVASVPANTTAPENSFTATFTITTSAVTANTVVTITAAYNGATRTATITVTPNAPPPGPTMSNLVVDSPVVGGSASQGAAVLSAAAPQGGAAVSLSSSNPGVASVPASVTVLAGNSGASFSISTTAVSASTTVTISATYNGTTRTAPLSVTPPAPPPPPPQTATLTVTASGRSGERITSNPAGINVATGSSGSASFASSTSITLSVTNGRSAIWSGACSSGGNKQTTCTFTITGTASVTANVQ
jgi:hypothetical protein